MNTETILWRQAHPNFVENETITSQVFMPFPKDKGKLSVYDGDQITAEESYQHYTQVLENESDSVWAVTKAECDHLNVPGLPDPLPDFESHAAIDFRGKSEKECRKIAKKLKTHALARGLQYRPASR